MRGPWQYKGTTSKGRTSRAAKQAYQDMRKDECTLAWLDILGTDHKVHVIITEEMLGIELKRNIVGRNDMNRRKNNKPTTCDRTSAKGREGSTGGDYNIRARFDSAPVHSVPRLDNGNQPRKRAVTR